MSRGRWIKGVAIVLALVAVVGIARAQALALWFDPCFTYRGDWLFPYGSGTLAKIRIQNNAHASQNVQVGIQARATDGTTVSGYKWVNIFGGQTYEVQIPLSKPATGLRIISARAPFGTKCAP